MSGVHIAAAITTILSLGIWIVPILWKAERQKVLKLSLALAVELPMCGLAFFFVRQPLMELLADLLGATSTAYQVVLPFWAPLTEEPAKLWPLLIPWLRRDLTPSDRIRLGLALGLGFGLGEIWFVATQAVSSATADLPWYMYGGLLGERFVVCFLHGVFTTLALWFLGRRLWLGLLLAMTLHFFLNFPIFLGAIDFAGLGQQTWSVIAQLWVMLAFVLAGALVIYLRFGLAQASGKEKDQPNFMLWHVLNSGLTLSFCFPAGIPGLVLSLMAQGEWGKGLKERALKKLRLAKSLFFVGLGLGVASTLTLVIWVLAMIPPSPPTEELTGEERERFLAEAEPIADNFLEGLFERDYEKFSRDLDTGMQKAVPTSRFDSMRQEVLDAFGPLESKRVARAERRGEYLAVVYDARYEKRRSIQLRIVFSKQEGSLKIAGFFNR